MRSRTDTALRCLAAAATAAALTLVAGVGQSRAAQGPPAVAPQLLAQAKERPAATFRVIASGRDGWTSERIANLLTHVGHASVAPDGLLESIRGVAASLTGADLAKLAGLQSGLLSIAPDSAVLLTDYSNSQEWAKAVQAPELWKLASSGRATPGIAIVDSGIDSGRSDFGGRSVKRVSLTSSSPNSSGDGYGHGTFVAALAAGAAGGATGAAPNAPLVSLDVVDDNGRAFTSDVIRAVDWIVANKAAYNIRVANFSLESAAPGTVRFDPLNAAVERLWLSGVVVVTAAGNSRTGDAPNGIAHAPANDPFVITVGALDLGAGGADTSDDTAAPWSSFGYTNDGFLKPELSAPGRGLV